MRGDLLTGCYGRYICICGEFSEDASHVQQIIDETYKSSFLGKRHAWILSLLRHLPPPRGYICGEETALIESLKGKQSKSCLESPFPDDVGLISYPITCRRSGSWSASFGILQVRIRVRSSSILVSVSTTLVWSNGDAYPI